MNKAKIVVACCVLLLLVACLSIGFGAFAENGTFKKVGNYVVPCLSLYNGTVANVSFAFSLAFNTGYEGATFYVNDVVQRSTLSLGVDGWQVHSFSPTFSDSYIGNPQPSKVIYDVSVIYRDVGGKIGDFVSSGKTFDVVSCAVDVVDNAFGKIYSFEDTSLKNKCYSLLTYTFTFSLGEDIGSFVVGFPSNSSNFGSFGSFVVSSSLEDSYNSGYRAGVNDSSSVIDMSSASYSAGLKSGYDTGFNKGYAEATSDNKTLFSYLAGVAQAPIDFLRESLSFEILGVSMYDFVCGLITVCGVVLVIRFCFGR